MERSKYECLVEAAANSGIEKELPPIKPGSEVNESQYLIVNGHEPPLNDAVTFAYETTDGTVRRITVDDGMRLQNDESFRHQRGYLSSTVQPAVPDQPVDLSVDRITKVDMQTGKQTTYAGTPVKEGTVSDTVDKFFKCRHPPLTS